MMITSMPFLSVIFFHCGWASAPSDNVTATSANKNKAAATRAVAKRFLIFTSPSQPRMRAISCHISYATFHMPYFICHISYDVWNLNLLQNFLLPKCEPTFRLLASEQRVNIRVRLERNRAIVNQG